MKFEELSKEDQELVNTDFGADLEKQAAEEIAEAVELYNMGFEKLAAEDVKAVEEEEKKKEEEEENDPVNKLTEGQKKEASAKGAFIAKGYLDGLMEKGASLHQDPYHYLYPALEEILVKEGADASKAKGIMEAVKGHYSKAKDAVKKAVKTVKDKSDAYHMEARVNKDIATGKYKHKVNPADEHGSMILNTPKDRVIAGLKAAGMYTPHAIVGAGGAYAAKKGYDKVKGDK